MLRRMKVTPEIRGGGCYWFSSSQAKKRIEGGEEKSTRHVCGTFVVEDGVLLERNESSRARLGAALDIRSE